MTELGRRGLVGQFFDYAGYQQLRAVENSDALRQFLQQCQYRSLPRIKAASEAADYLLSVNCKMDRQETPWSLAAMLTGLVVRLWIFSFGHAC